MTVLPDETSAAWADDPCPLAPAVDVLFARWTSHVLWVLSQHGRMRFTQLRDRVPAVTPKVLTERLRRLERDGLVVRTVYAEVPPRVEYSLTELARSALPALRTLASWSDEHRGAIARARAVYDSAGRG